jgi:hypothetical protein
MPFCPHCGSPNDRGQVFCNSCGAPLPEEVPVTQRSHPPSPVNSPAAPPLSPPARAMQSPLRPKTVLSPVLVLGLIGLVFIIGVAAFFALSGSPLSAGTQNSSGGSQDSGILPVIGQCSANLSKCSGKCVNLQTDPDNCGACGFSVPYGETCINGQFSSSLEQSKSGSSTAPSGTTPAGSSLTSVTATGVQGSCPTGLSSCNGTCRDLSNDAKNCGSCGNICPSGQNCQNDRCILPGTSAPVVSTSVPITIVPELSCSGRETLCGNSCVDVFSDKKNCGVCSRACKSQEICVNARCGPACTESGTSLCGDSCVDLDTDMNNCGSCGTECETFLPNAKGSLCTNGQCIISQCKPDYSDCNKKISDGCEVNLRLDASNCGACGGKCPEGQVCYSRKCSKPVGT